MPLAISAACMPSSVGLPEGELSIAVNFMMAFGMDWVETKKVREFIFDNPIDGVWLHRLLEQKIDPLSPVNGITHRKLKPEVLDRIRNYKDVSG